jgi:hypothetical protein
MDSVLNVLHATIASHPRERQGEVTLSKVNLLLYLVDWHLWINDKMGVSGVSWVNGSYGPYSAEVKSALERRAFFKKLERETNSGRSVVCYDVVGVAQEISKNTNNSIKHVLKLDDERRSPSAGDPGAEFKRLVLSTYGVMHTEKGDTIDIQNQAAKYRQVRGL